MKKNSTASSFRSLEDCTALEYILLGDLRDLLEEVPDEVNRYWLVSVLDTLLVMIPREMSLQDVEGEYLDEVLQNFPSWNRRVVDLRQRKQSLYNTLHELRARLSAQSPYRHLAIQLRRELREWMAEFVAHHQEENELLQTAFNLEIGGDG